MQVQAAVVRSFDEPPRYEPFALPEPTDEDQALVDVVAVGLHPRVRSRAAGTHYTSTGALPLVPGIDGVGRRADGRLVYFVADDDLVGPMATRTVVDTRRCIPLPDGADVVKLAAAMNPAMSSWIALRRRVSITPGQSVLVLGATGNAGAMAIQVAKRLGAGLVVGAGRDRERLASLPGLGADGMVALTADAQATGEALASAAKDVDVVLDYLWGAPTTAAMIAILTARTDRSRALDWIQIGSMAGPTIDLPSAVLRAANLRLLGSGQGSVALRDYLAELPLLVDEIDSGRLSVTTRTVPLADVAAVWTAREVPGVRTVLVP